ncbi:methyltransferase [Pseudonocardia xinjiangensis]|uniref:O-methyltransferase C-terminal domain-containing protein n=1 Tax=Pseudonocardia xinjiangensis TaxID=75289 RepID=A0ABX1RGN4_9PSEU|nr:methyltransferase [Pseudonocardia xinjiangensis]NMH78604.1 hypothetical protein [Pseudonocardia xinjiangensis]
MNDVDEERARLVSFIWNSFIPHVLYSLVSFGVVDLLADGAAPADQLAEISRSVALSLHVLGIAGHGRIADVGGGSGALLAGVLAANPQTLGLLYDTDSGLCEAEATLTEAGVRDRCEIVSGDFFESVPGGCDANLLKHIVHDWDDERAATVLTRCRESKTADARLYLIESVVPTDPAAFDIAMLVRDLNMLIELPGRARTQAEFAELLAISGLRSAIS